MIGSTPSRRLSHAYVEELDSQSALRHAHLCRDATQSQPSITHLCRNVAHSQPCAQQDLERTSSMRA